MCKTPFSIDEKNTEPRVWFWVLTNKEIIFVMMFTVTIRFLVSRWINLILQSPISINIILLTCTTDVHEEKTVVFAHEH